MTVPSLADFYRGRAVVIAGGAGFIGSHLAERLIALGAGVTVIDNELTGSRKNLAGSPAVTFIRADVTEPLPPLSPEPAAVFNLASAASPVHYTKYAIETLRAGSKGTENLLDLAEKSGAVFVQASTSEVYGDPDIHPQPESYWGRVNPVGPRSMYDEAKRYGEALCVAYERSRGANVRIARIFNTYGPRMQLDDGRVVPNFIAQALRGEPLTVYGDGKQTRSFCYVSDLVDGLLRLGASDVRGPVNLGTGDERTILDFAGLIRKLTGAQSEIAFRPLPTDDPLQRKPDNTRARQLLGWEPAVPLEDGLKETIRYFQKVMGA